MGTPIPVSPTKKKKRYIRLLSLAPVEQADIGVPLPENTKLVWVFPVGQSIAVVIMEEVE
jgi:hypothetical protein